MIKTLKRLGAYMGGRRWLLPCSVGLSALNGLLSLVPFILLWLVVRTLLTAEGDLAQDEEVTDQGDVEDDLRDPQPGADEQRADQRRDRQRGDPAQRATTQLV